MLIQYDTPVCEMGQNVQASRRVFWRHWRPWCISTSYRLSNSTSLCSRRIRLTRFARRFQDLVNDTLITSDSYTQYTGTTATKQNSCTCNYISWCSRKLFLCSAFPTFCLIAYLIKYNYVSVPTFARPRRLETGFITCVRGQNPINITKEDRFSSYVNEIFGFSILHVTSGMP